MQLLAKFGVSVLVMAIVLPSVKTDRQSAPRPTPVVAAKLSKRKTSVKPRNVERPRIALETRRSFTDPKSKHANLVGQKIHLGTPGKWTVVHFWATWCGKCIETSPELVKLHGKYAQQGVEFFGVNLDKDQAAMTSYVSKTGLAWPQMVTEDGWESPVRIEHKVPTIPAVYLVSPSGVVVEAGMRTFEDADTRLQYHLGRRGR